MKLSFFVYLILFVGGCYVSELLVDLHIQAHLGGPDSGLCAAGAGFSCVDVATSSFSSIFGIPIASIGLAFYLAGIVLVCIAYFLPKLIEGLPDVFLAGGVLATVYSVFLGIASSFVIGKICPLCLVLYGINIALLVTAWVSHPDGGTAAFKRAHRVVLLPGFWAAAGLLAFAIPATQFTYTRSAEAAIAQAKKTKAPTAPKGPVTVDVGNSPAQGDPNAPVTIVEFSDFECPYCKKLSDNLKAAMAMAPGVFKYHFKHYPMDNSCNRDIEFKMHEQACNAAVAMVCAQRLGRAWEMHDRLFDNQKSLSKKAMLAMAATIGVDVERFSACMNSSEAVDMVKADIDQGIKLGVRGTPTWFINGVQQVGATEPAEIVALAHQTQRELKTKKAKQAETEDSGGQ